MTETGVMCSNADVKMKAGKNVNSTATGETYTNYFISGAQALINITARKNYTDLYATLNDDVRFLLNEIASDIAAIYAIQYDMSGFTTRTEAEDMIKILESAANRGLRLLDESERRAFIENA
jgi:hypothetical protein